MLEGRVTRVVDGDTFWIDSASTSIRVWGLDAPEVDQRGGSQATATLERLIAGQRLSCRSATSTGTAASSASVFSRMAATSRRR